MTAGLIEQARFDQASFEPSFLMWRVLKPRQVCFHKTPDIACHAVALRKVIGEFNRVKISTGKIPKIRWQRLNFLPQFYRFGIMLEKGQVRSPLRPGRAH